MKQKNDELQESVNNLLEILRTCEGVGPVDPWLRSEVQQLGNRAQQVNTEVDLISNEIDQIKEELDQIEDEMDQIKDEMDQIGQLDSASPLPTLANLPSLRRAVQIVIDGENVFELTTEILASLQA